jgi:hypothetical protein
MLKLEQLAELLEKNRAAVSARVKEFSIGGKAFAFNLQPAIMGVINLSPDSWYRESVCLRKARTSWTSARNPRWRTPRAWMTRRKTAN